MEKHEKIFFVRFLPHFTVKAVILRRMDTTRVEWKFVLSPQMKWNWVVCRLTCVCVYLRGWLDYNEDDMWHFFPLWRRPTRKVFIVHSPSYLILSAQNMMAFLWILSKWASNLTTSSCWWTTTLTSWKIEKNLESAAIVFMQFNCPHCT